MNLHMGKQSARSKAPAETETRGPAARVDEVSAALGGEIARCLTRAAEHAEVLESIGAQSFTVTCETFSNASATELRHQSHAIRGLVVHALAAVADLQFIAGRLDALAALRAADAATREEEN